MKIIKSKSYEDNKYVVSIKTTERESKVRELYIIEETFSHCSYFPTIDFFLDYDGDSYRVLFLLKKLYYIYIEGDK